MLAMMQRKRISFALLVGTQTSAATLENGMDVPQKPENRTTLWSSKCTTRYLPKGYRRVLIQRGTCTPMFIAALSTRGKLWKEPKCPSTDEWIAKMWFIYLYTGLLLSHKKEWSLAMCNDVDGATQYYAKRNQSVRERQIPFDFTHT